MNYPVFRNLSFLACAWQSLAIRFRCCRHSERLITCRSGCVGVSGANMTCNNLLASGSVIPVSVFPPQAPPFQHQEPKCQHHQRHVVVPTAPTSNFVVVQTYLLLSPQEAVFNGPAV